MFVCGCAAQPQEHIPTYPWTDDRAALQNMAQRARSIQTVSSACSLNLTRADGQSVRLDGAIALSIADKRVRLRAWKFNQAVFDLTWTDSGLWLEVPGEGNRRAQVFPAGLSAAQLARALSLFGPDIFNDHLQIRDTGGSTFEFTRPAANGQTMIARIDRPTLTVRQYRMLDTARRVRFTLDLSRYEQIGGIVCPTYMTALNDGSRIDVELRDVQINVPLPPAAFVPPRGAEKVP
jgi:outer membrane lipoprotein-sorting protein